MCPGDGEGSGSTTSTGSPATRAGGGREGRSSGSPRGAGGGGGGAGQSAEPGRRRCHGRSVRGVSGERRWLPLKGAWRGGTAGGGRFRCRGPWAGSPADSATPGWACAGEGRAGNAGLRRPEAAPGNGGGDGVGRGGRDWAEAGVSAGTAPGCRFCGGEEKKRDKKAKMKVKSARKCDLGVKRSVRGASGACPGRAVSKGESCRALSGRGRPGLVREKRESG